MSSWPFTWWPYPSCRTDRILFEARGGRHRSNTLFLSDYSISYHVCGVDTSAQFYMLDCCHLNMYNLFASWHEHLTIHWWPWPESQLCRLTGYCLRQEEADKGQIHCSHISLPIYILSCYISWQWRIARLFESPAPSEIAHTNTNSVFGSFQFFPFL